MNMSTKDDNFEGSEIWTNLW